MNTLRSLSLVSLALVAAPVAVFAQGSLTPAGAPAPMMKTLAQIESRVDVATLPGDATAVRVITQPGSYYLTSDVVGAAGKGGIRIEASDVTLDLNGYVVRGTIVTSLDGISCPGGEAPTYERISIRNGTVIGWGGAGVFGGNSTSFVVEHVRVAGCVGAGIHLLGGGQIHVEHCDVISVRRFGIYCAGIGTDCQVRNCTVTSVTSTEDSCGIYAYGGMVEHCRVRGVSGNGATGIDLDFQTGRVANCDVSQITSNSPGAKVIGMDAPEIVDCTISLITGGSNASGYGIYSTYPMVLSRTRITDIGGFNAFGVYSHYALDAFGSNGNAAVQGCFVANVTSTGGTACGIAARQTLDCQVTAVQGDSTAAHGIIVHAGGMVSRCSINNVEGNGIDLSNTASAVGNSISAAGKDGTGAGIYVSSGAGRVEGNRVTNSAVGINQTALTALVIGNFAQGNTTNYIGVYAGSIVSTYANVVAGSSVLNVSF